jgi:flagellar hook protein FlgE
MSLFGAMRTSVAGMNAQAHRIGTVSENIANVSTTGYKRARAEFETVVGSHTIAPYYTGGVMTQIQTLNDEQGNLQLTGQPNDLAIRGQGYFVVQAPDGTPGLTRAGAFIPDAMGLLRNTAGQYLLGYDLTDAAAAPANGFAGLTRIDANQVSLTALPSTAGFLTSNLNSDLAVGQSSKTSLIAYDNLGTKKQLDFTFTKTAANAWTLDIVGAASPITQSLVFDSTTGNIQSPTSLSIPIANGSTIAFDVSKMTQLAANFTVAQASINGHAPSQLDRVEINKNGVVAAVYQDGTVVQKYKIPLATVVSPDNLTSLSGNIFWESVDSGQIVLSDAETGGRGSIISGALEASTTDLSNELTTMIEAQRGYTGNSKVFQAGSDMLDVLMSLKV